MAVEEQIRLKKTELATMRNDVTTLRAQIDAAAAKGLATGDDQTKLNAIVDGGTEIRKALARLEDELALTVDLKSDDGLAERMARNGGYPLRKAWGQMAIESPQFKNKLTGLHDRVKVGALPIGRKDLYEATDATGGAAIQNQRLEMVSLAPQRPLTILDLINRSRTSVDAVEYPTLVSRDNQSGVKAEYSAGWVSAAESNLVMGLETVNVKTIATYIETSMQLLDDAPRMEDLINSELKYMVEVKLEDQVLAGGGGANFTGINAAANIQTRVHQVSGRGYSSDDKIVDTIRRAITDITLEFYRPSGIILHPNQGEAMELDKDDNGRYTEIYDTTANRVWRVPVLETPAQTAGTATVADFKMAATLWDRLDTQIRMGQPGDLFLQLAFAVIAYLRAAFAVTRPLAVEKITGLAA